MRHTLVLVLVAVLAFPAAARRPPPGPREPQPTVGDALDIRTSKDYLGKDMQAVLSIQPGSANRRIVSRETGEISGMRRRRGMTVWMKKRDKYPWEKPWEDPMSAPFKLRFLRQDPAGIMLSQYKQGKVLMKQSSSKGKSVLSVSLPKPKPWYRMFF